MGLWSSKVRDVRVSLSLAFSEGAGAAQNAEYRCCYCVLYLARAFMLTFTRSALLWRAGTVLVRLQEGRGVVRFAFAGVAAASDRAARAAPAEHAACAVRAVCAEHAACAEHAVCDVRAAVQRVRLSVKDGVKAMRVALKAMRAAHVCYVVVVSGVLREYAQYLRARRAPCASTLWRQRRSPLLPTFLPWPHQNSRA